MNKIFVWLGIVLIAIVSCRKRDSNSKKCNYALFAFKRIDTNIYKMIRVDTATGQNSDYLSFPEVYNTNGYLDEDTRCYYTVQIEGGELKLLKFDLINSKFSVYSGGVWPADGKATRLFLTFSNATSQFYFLYSHVVDSLSLYEWELYDITISGNTFVKTKVALTPRPDGVFAPLISNKKNGDIYFESRESGRFKFAPKEKEVTKVTFKRALDYALYNKNSDILYGVYVAGGGAPIEFLNENPSNGIITKIANLFPMQAKYTTSTFDNCRSQYIVQNGGTDTVVDIYWLDTKDGSVRKHLTARDAYVGLICVNLD